MGEEQKKKSTRNTPNLLLPALALSYIVATGNFAAVLGLAAIVILALMLYTFRRREAAGPPVDGASSRKSIKMRNLSIGAVVSYRVVESLSSHWLHISVLESDSFLFAVAAGSVALMWHALTLQARERQKEPEVFSEITSPEIIPQADSLGYQVAFFVLVGGLLWLILPPEKDLAPKSKMATGISTATSEGRGSRAGIQPRRDHPRAPQP